MPDYVFIDLCNDYRNLPQHEPVVVPVKREYPARSCLRCTLAHLGTKALPITTRPIQALCVEGDCMTQLLSMPIIVQCYRDGDSVLLQCGCAEHDVNGREGNIWPR